MGDNKYDFSVVVPKVEKRYYKRRYKLVGGSGSLYLGRAAERAQKGYFFSAMKDVFIALSYNPESVVLMILNSDLGAASDFLATVTTNCIQLVQPKDGICIMEFAELADDIFKRVEGTFNQALQAIAGGEEAKIHKVNVLAEVFQTHREDLMNAVWDNAASAVNLAITSYNQFDLYKRFVLVRSDQIAVLTLKNKGFKKTEWSEILEGHGITYLIDGLGSRRMLL